MSNQGNSGMLSKFQQRLRKIRLSRNKKYMRNQEFIKGKVDEIRKTVRKDPTFTYKRVKPKVIGEKQEKKENSISQVIVDIKKTEKDRNYTKKIGTIDQIVKESSTQKQEVVSEKKEDHSKKEDKTFVKMDRPKKVGYVPISERKNIKTSSNEEKEELLNKLGLDIIEQIKYHLEDKLDQLEVLNSELYFLEKNQENELELKKVKELKKKINELLQNVNQIIEQYNLYKSNYYLDNVIGIDDNILVDNIIEYRDLLDSFSDEKRFVKEYKALDEFKSLYLNLKVVQADAEKLVQNNEHKIEAYDIRDKKYDKIKMGLVPVQDIDHKCSLEIDKQNEYFTNLMKDINKINKEEYTTTHLRGVGELVNMSLRYMGLMLLAPLSGLIPGIATQTLATKRMIGNIYQNMHYEEVKHIRYKAINYDSELNHHLCSVDYTANLLEDTLRDVNRLKNDFMLQYDSRIPGYQATLKNIQNIEKKLIHNQNRVEIIRHNLKKSKKLNENKMIRVRKMNDQNG